MSSWNYMAGIEYNTFMTEINTRHAADQAARDARAQIEASRETTLAVIENTYQLKSIQHDIQRSVEINNKNFASLIEINQTGFKTLAEKLDKQQATLERIEEAVVNPRANAARELFLVGLQMLRMNLYPEAIKKFKESLESDDLQAITYLALSLAYQQNGDHDEIFSTLRSAFRYGDFTSKVKLNGSSVIPLRFKETVAVLASETAVTEEEQREAFNMLNEMRNFLHEAATIDLSSFDNEVEMINVPARQNNKTPRVSYAAAVLGSKLNEPEIVREALTETLKLKPEYSLRAINDNVLNAIETAEEVFATNEIFNHMRRLIEYVERDNPEFDIKVYDDPAIMMGTYPALIERYASEEHKDYYYELYKYLDTKPVYPNQAGAAIDAEIYNAQQRYNQEAKNMASVRPIKPGMFAKKHEKQRYENALVYEQQKLQECENAIHEAMEKKNKLDTAYDAKVREWEDASKTYNTHEIFKLHNSAFWAKPSYSDLFVLS